MNALPVIVRELRSEARNPFTFSLRLVGVVILLALLAFFWLTTPFAPNAGDLLFTRLHMALFFSIWILVPLVAADCISRERRENTLGLLFLTPLRPLDIVLAKGLVHGLRALAFWLAVWPVLAVPLLLGGVSWVTALTAVIVNFSAVCWALAAGLLASALCKTRTQALAVSACLALLSFLAFGYLTGLILFGTLPGGWETHWMEKLVRGLWLNTQLTLDWSYFRGVPAAARRGFGSQTQLWITGKVGLASAFALFLTLVVAGQILRRVWQDKPASEAWIWFQRVFCTPFIWRAFFERWIRRKLESNPIGWLEQRQWTGRTAIAAWLAVIITFYLAMLQDASPYRRFSTGIQSSMACLLALSLAVAAAGSFRRERELGVMELLLVTPLGARRIALGRLRGLWEQFLPATALLLAMWIYIAATFGNPADWPRIVFAATTLTTIPVVGLYFSLRERSLIGALAWTVLIGLLLPRSLPAVLPFLDFLDLEALRLAPWSPWEMGSGLWLLAAACQVAVALLYWRRLQTVLRQREFPMEVR